MANLDINLYGFPDEDKVSSISICIQWQKAPDYITANSSHSLTSNREELNQHPAAVTPVREDLHQTHHINTSQPRDRLRPTDRLVLYALHARVPQGQKTTIPVRLHELMDECSISRKQVQICLKRLAEKGIISRVTEGVVVGTQEGYSYRISQINK